NAGGPSVYDARPTSFDAIMGNCNYIAAALPEYHINDIVQAMAQFVSENPEQARLFLGPLIQKQDG
ncbi:MAG: hypothetical protein AAF705_10675, partial [Bacteroidota bacterium]